MMNLADQVPKILEELLKTTKHPVALHEPSFRGNETRYVSECIETGWVSSVGKFVDRFESDLAEFCGARHAVAVCNGTAALHVALRLAGVQPGDEVFVPALSFVATANAVSYIGARPHFVDIEETTLGLDPEKLREYLKDLATRRNGQLINKHTGCRLAAIVPMHTFGHPVRLDELLNVAHEFDIPVVEDAAEALGSYYRGTHVGTVGKLGILSFNGNKIITTGGGGAILTNDEALAKEAKHLTTTAKLPSPWEFVHDRIGFNYRMPNLNAALGCAQLESLPQLLASKRELASRYKAAFASVEGITFFSETEDARSNYWLNALLLRTPDPACLHSILERCHAHGIQARPAWKLLSELPMYAGCPAGSLSQATRFSHSIVCLPSSAQLISDFSQ